MNYLEQIETIFDELQAAAMPMPANQYGEGRESNPAKNVATSLVWSLCSQTANLIGVLNSLDHPDNPSRPANTEVASERTRRLEHRIEEREYLISWLSTKTSSELLPDARLFCQRSDDRVPRHQPLTSEDLSAQAEEAFCDVEDLIAMQQADQEVRVRSRRLINETIAAHEREIVARLNDAMCNVQRFDGDIAPSTAQMVFAKMLRPLSKLKGRNALTIQRVMSNVVRARHKGQNMLIQKVIAQLIDPALEHTLFAMEESDFEPMREFGRSEDTVPRHEVDEAA